MALIKTEPIAAFNLEEIQRGDLFWGKHSSWDEGKAGFVTSVTENQLVVQYHPGIGNVTNHFIILAKEYEEWAMRWSSDLASVNSFPQETVGSDAEVGDELQ